jgi:hypothetical protein
VLAAASWRSTGTAHFAIEVPEVPIPRVFDDAVEGDEQTDGDSPHRTLDHRDEAFRL